MNEWKRHEEYTIEELRAEITKLNEAIDTLRELREFDRKVVVAKLDKILEVLGVR